MHVSRIQDTMPVLMPSTLSRKRIIFHWTPLNIMPYPVPVLSAVRRFCSSSPYMNLSGEAIIEFVRFFKIDPEDELLVIYDDISLEPGKLRLRRKGSAGGHNGIKNIIAHLGTEKFKRIKIGVGSKPEGWDLKDFVLGHFSKEDQALMQDAFSRTADAVDLIVADEFDKAMNTYN